MPGCLTTDGGAITCLLLFLFWACVCDVDAHFNLFMNESETRRLLGIPGDLFYVKDGTINEYALTFNLPIKSHVDEIYFNWQNLRSNMPIHYSILANVSTPGVINHPVISIAKEGFVPIKPSMFSVTIACSGAASADVDVRLQLNASFVSPMNVTTLDLKRKKTCIKDSSKPTDIDHINDDYHEQTTGRSTAVLTAAEHGLQVLTSGNNPLYIGVGGACAIVIVCFTVVLVRRFRLNARRKSTIRLVSNGCERPLTQHPYQLSIKPYYRTDTPTSNSIISGVGSIHRGLSYVVYSELKPSDVDSMLGDMHVDSTRIQLGDVLLEGSFSRVYRGSFTAGPNYSDCRPVIIKTVTEQARKDQIQAMLRDACLTKGVLNANVAAIMGVSLHGAEDHIHTMVLYGVDGMDSHNLKSFLHRCRIADMLAVHNQIYMSLQINSALQHLHRRRIVHRDVATRNCLVDGQLRVRLTDGALSRDLFPHDYQLTCLGDLESKPVKWMSPETLLERRYSPASDVWSFGVTLWELFTFADQPYFDIEATEMVEYLKQGYRVSQPVNCPIEIYQLIVCCWNLNSDDRPRLSQLHVCLQQFYSAMTQYV